MILTKPKNKLSAKPKYKRIIAKTSAIQKTHAAIKMTSYIYNTLVIILSLFSSNVNMIFALVDDYFVHIVYSQDKYL